jgi:hypothetical protein
VAAVEVVAGDAEAAEVEVEVDGGRRESKNLRSAEPKNRNSDEPKN